MLALKSQCSMHHYTCLPTGPRCPLVLVIASAFSHPKGKGRKSSTHFHLHLTDQGLVTWPNHLQRRLVSTVFHPRGHMLSKNGRVHKGRKDVGSQTSTICHRTTNKDLYDQITSLSPLTSQQSHINTPSLSAMLNYLQFPDPHTELCHA